MRARQLEVFIAIMRAGSVTAAARMLAISQPALSQILIHTEDTLGFALFDRTKGRLKPTPEALEILPEAERIFAGLEGLRRKTADLRGGRAGLVRVAASTPPAMALLPQILQAYRARYPEILIRSHVAPVQSMVGLLRSGDAALALALEDELPPDIEVEPLDTIGFCCVLPREHRLCAQDQIRFADLAGEALISYRAATRPQAELARAARAQGAAFAPDLEIDTSISALGFVAQGLGVALVDDLLPWDQFGAVARRPLASSPRLPLALLSLRGKSLSHAEELMRAQIKAALPLRV